MRCAEGRWDWDFQDHSGPELTDRPAASSRVLEIGGLIRALCDVRESAVNQGIVRLSKERD